MNFFSIGKSGVKDKKIQKDIKSKPVSAGHQ